MVASQSCVVANVSLRSSPFAGRRAILKLRHSQQDMRLRSFTLNGEITEIEPHKQHLSAAEYIRQFAHCKSIKVGCNEGGCGACAVELVHHDAATGKDRVLAVNSCLLPVGALAGAAVVTAEGLGNNTQGLNPVQARLSAFHGTQCGFCSPGIAVSCHAALTAAAAAGRTSTTSDASSNTAQQQCNGPNSFADANQQQACDGLCDDQGHGHALETGTNSATDTSNGTTSSSSSDGSSSIVVASAADLLASLDGNLCRCTGWRPIADMVKSFACDVDVEDLGLSSMEPQQQLGPVTIQQLAPACRKQQPHKQQQQQQQQQQDFMASLRYLQPGRFYTPTSLDQLLSAMQAATLAGLPLHLVAGNTAAGIYKQQWQQLAESVCIVVNNVAALQQLSVKGYNNTSSRGFSHLSKQIRANSSSSSSNSSSHITVSSSGVSGSPCTAERDHKQRVRNDVVLFTRTGRNSSSSSSSSSSNSSSSSSSSSSNKERSITRGRHPYILAGSGVTLTQLVNLLKDLVAAETAAGQQQHVQNLSFLLSHVTRIAGTLVRNAATLGGHLMLLRSQHLESDLEPILIAAGAELQITDVNKTSLWIPVQDFVASGTPAGSNPGQTPRSGISRVSDSMIKQLGHSALITAVKIPLPLAAAAAAVPAGSSSSDANSASPSVWSYKLTTHRYGNEHSAVNMCCWFSPHNTAAAADGGVGQQDDNSSASCGYDLRIAIGTYQEAASQHGTSQQHSSTSSSKVKSAEVWTCSRAAHVETAVLQALQQHDQLSGLEDTQQQQSALQSSSSSSLYDVLSQLPQLIAQDVHPAGRMAEYVRSVSPALVLKGLATILPAHYTQPQPTPQASLSLTTPPSSTSSIPSDTITVTPAMMKELRSSSVSALSSRPVPRGVQDVPVDVSAAPPLYWPTQKDGSHLQVTGEAEFADDVALTAGALYAAYVPSTQPYAKLLDIDWSAALSVEGVVGYVTPNDIPAGPNSAFNRSLWTFPTEPLFAHDTVEYVGQPLGLVVATTLSAARAGSARVGVRYGPVVLRDRDDRSGDAGQAGKQSEATSRAAAADVGMGSADVASADVSGGNDGQADEAAKPLTSLNAAIEANSWYDLSKFQGSRACKGDVPAALSSSSRVLAGQLKLGSQRHFYMEPQTAVATPDEGGRMNLISSCQGTDQVLHPVARLLKLKHNQVHISCKRVGGGFGGKADRAVYPAGAAAVAAHKFRRQVRLVVDSSVDAGMNAGRCPMVVDWTAGLDDKDQLQALKVDIKLAAGAYIGTTTVEISHLPMGMDSVYVIPAFQVTVQAARCNLPPRTTVRGPGKVSAALIIEQIVHQLAAAVGQTPEQYREQLMIKIPQQHLETAAAAEAKALGKGVQGSLHRQANGFDGSQHSREVFSSVLGKEVTHQRQRQQQQSLTSATADHCSDLVSNGPTPHPKYYPRPSESTDKQQQGTAPPLTLQTAQGKSISLHTYTLPHMWQQLQHLSEYGARRTAVDEFNKQHKLKKRGLALVPVRFETMQGKRLATVTLYSDGSILLMHPGTEMGQGIATKVQQTAAATLGQLLPEGQAGVLLDYIRVATSSTELLPHSGLAAASTTSESATAAVAAACDILLERLQPAADKIAAAAADTNSVGGSGPDESCTLWEKIVAEVAEVHAILTSRVVMTATALAGFNGDVDGGYFLYHTFGVAAAEVEIDCCTGERQLLRADMMFDAGRSVNPAIDLGQVEGAFMMGVGHVLHEEVVEDEVTGKTVSQTTWEYKPPGIHELPAELNVHMLKDSPMHMPKRKQLSAKATGEPPMLMSAAVACALRDAVAAAWVDYKEHRNLQQQDHHREQQYVTDGCDKTNGTVQSDGSNGQHADLRREVLQSGLELPATTVNVKMALPPLL